MLKASKAVEITQRVNRDNWLDNAKRELDSFIKDAAASGLGSVVVPFESLIIGAENLAECGEMLAMLHKALTDAGYKNRVSVDGEIIITWKEVNM